MSMICCIVSQSHANFRVWKKGFMRGIVVWEVYLFAFSIIFLSPTGCYGKVQQAKGHKEGRYPQHLSNASLFDLLPYVLPLLSLLSTTPQSHIVMKFEKVHVVIMSLVNWFRTRFLYTCTYHTYYSHKTKLTSYRRQCTFIGPFFLVYSQQITSWRSAGVNTWRPNCPTSRGWSLTTIAGPELPVTWRQPGYFFRFRVDARCNTGGLSQILLISLALL